MTVHDVAVVGAGPAGASAARVLAEAGARVVLLEKRDVPRYKTCGGGLVGRALRGLPSCVRDDVEAAVVERTCHTADLDLGHDGLRFRARRERPLISMVMRDRFDAALVAAAARAGAEVRPRCAVRAVTVEADRTRLETTDGSVVARFVVAADGATSETARLCGWGPARLCAPALEAEVRVTDADFARLAATARFDFGPVRAGYGWVFPKRDHLSIGVCSMRSGVNLNVGLAQYLAALGLDRPDHVEKHGFFVTLGARAEGVARGRVLLAGDAAGLADPVTGEGISTAIESGTFAARAILDGDGEPARVRERYERLLARLRREVRIGRELAKLTYERPRIRRWVFGHHGQRIVEGMIDVLTGDRTYASILGRAKTWTFLLGLSR
ncbi:MAG TPA: geranylgeranyl reductase family protein [Candidatus Acidoferrum sp.]|nr:geranylgeranyl reductase family protein [Candidatus Acidoferrum sp.]